MMMKCLIIGLTFIVALTESAITDADRTALIHKLNTIRASAGGSNMRKLIYDPQLTVTLANGANCVPTFEPGKDWVFRGDHLAVALTAMDVEVTKGKADYHMNVVCGGSNDKQCKVYKDIVNAFSTKVNCDLKACDDTSSVKHQIIKCFIQPAYTGNDAAFLRGTACSACGPGYKCESEGGKLCIPDSSSRSHGIDTSSHSHIIDTNSHTDRSDTGGKQLNQNVYLVVKGRI